ncbi:MAG TPA: hypothetical protein VJW94_00025 [Candidatus Acidoferrum sp.]|nr:hypothetical protein [Candidatus Acidoferrum sp.]
MRVSAIQTLKPNVTQEEAVRGFRSGIFSGVYWRIRSGPLQRIADAYVPFWVFRVRYEIGKARKTRFFALDAVHGDLDLFEFPRVPAGEELVTVQTRNLLVARLQPDAAEEILRTKVLRVLFQQGFFKLRGLKVEIERLPTELHLPYWLAFYGGNGAVKCRVMDAVRRRIEGAKASSFFEEWLAA